MEVRQRQGVVDKHHLEISISRQCELLSINRSSLYHQPQSSHFDWDEPLKQEIRLIMLEFPYYGSRKVTAHLHAKGIRVGRRRITRLLRSMGLKAIQPKKWKGGKRKDHPVHPYRLENLVITGSNQVWGTDITYIPTRYGWVYLVAIMDLYSRMILGWRLSGTLEAEPCIQLLKETVAQYGPPQILNQDQGSQFTSQNWLNTAESFGILISMASKGRCYDNIHVERGWRSLKQEEVYLKEYHSLGDARMNIARYIQQYNHHRLHQALGYKTPASAYSAGSLWNQSTPGKEVKTDSLLCV